MRKLLFTVGLALLLCGCQNIESFVKTGNPMPETLVSGPDQMKDIPVPCDFEYNPESSFRHHTNFQAARLCYVKSNNLSDLDRLVEFYESEFPKKGWAVKFVTGRRTRTIIAEKADSVCEITLAIKYQQNRTLLIVKRSTDNPQRT